jgi:hypothetical protein
MMLVRVHSNLRLVRKRKRADIDDDENAAMADDERASEGSCTDSDSE